MYNGNHHEEEAGAAAKPRPETKPEAKPATLQKPEQQAKVEPSKK
jgi:hypothetical protein